MRGTLFERFRAYLGKYPHDVWRGVQEWQHTPNSKLVFAWFADVCGVYEATDSLDPIEIARAEGRREAFFALWDLCNAHGMDILEIQRQALGEGER